MPKLKVEQIPARSSKYGRYPERETRQLTWTGKLDGRKFTLRARMRERPYTIYPGIGASTWSRPQLSESYKDYDKKPRLYVYFPSESLLDNLVNRTSRPSAALGKLVRPLLAHLELGGKVGWYAKAGCSCPCSPGFVWTDAPALDFGTGPTRRYDAYLELEDVPTVKDDPATRRTRSARLASLEADPTLDLPAMANTPL